MKAFTICTAAALPALAFTLTGTPSAWSADDVPHKLGDHPAVVVQRLYKTAGYDYASKFYPHPAWLYLYAKPPGDDASAFAGTAESPLRPAEPSAAREVALPRTRPETPAGG